MPAKKTSSKSPRPSKPVSARPVKVKPSAGKAAAKVAKKSVKPTPKPSRKPVAVKASPTKTAQQPAVKPTPATKPAAAAAAPAPQAAVTPPPTTPAAAAADKASGDKASGDKSAKGKPAVRKEVVATFVQRNPRPVEPPPDAEDGDEHSLLAGPRNVQPYIVKRGEQYMSREQLDHFRTILQSWRSDLMREVDRTVSHMKDEAANFPDPNDRATQEEEFSLELRTRDRERKLIRKIEEALERIEDGSYGYCLETGEEIGIKRLEARPVATLSLEAQERRERREKQYGDRDDRYR